MKILIWHKCGHEQEWLKPIPVFVKNNDLMERYKIWLEKMNCINCEMKRTGATIN